MSDAFTLVLMILTTFRMTWLIVKDSFPPIKLVRDRIVEKHYETSTPVAYREMGDPDTRYQTYRGKWFWLAELITCPWCVSVWMAALVTIATALLSPRGLSMPWLWFGATAGGAALIAQLLVSITDRE